MTKVTIDIAQKELANLIDNVVLGGHVIILKDKKPVVELVAIHKKKRVPQFGSAKGKLSISEDFDTPLKDFDEYMQ